MTKDDWIEIKSIYAEAGNFFERIERILRKRRNGFYGYRILNSPPVFKPEYVFVSYQPGGRNDPDKHECDGGKLQQWPTDTEHLTGPGHLARRMQDLFPLEILVRSVGLNAIFLRWPNVQGYKVDVPLPIRHEVEAFSSAKAQRIIEIVQPQNIVTLGFAPLKLSSVEASPELASKSGGDLILKGEIWGHDAIGVKHLSGSRISSADLLKIKRHLSSEYTE